MSQNHPSTKTLTRRALLANSATGFAVAGIAATGFGVSAARAASPLAVKAATGQGLAGHALCAAHHQELRDHLSSILNASYVDERMKNQVLTTTHCPHCKVAIAPDLKSQAAFAALS